MGVYWSDDPPDSFLQHDFKIGNLKLINVQGPTKKIQHNKVDFVTVQIELCSKDGLFHDLFGDFLDGAFLHFHILLNQRMELTHEFSGFLHQINLFFLRINSDISHKFRKHGLYNRGSF